MELSIDMEKLFEERVRAFCNSRSDTAPLDGLYVRWVETNGKLPDDKTAEEFVTQMMPQADDIGVRYEEASYYYTFKPSMFAHEMKLKSDMRVSESDSGYVFKLGEETFTMPKNGPVTLEWEGRGIKTVIEKDTDYYKLGKWMEQAVALYKNTFEYFRKANDKVIERARIRHRIESEYLAKLGETVGDTVLAYAVEADPEGAKVHIGRENVFSTSLRIDYDDSWEEKLQQMALSCAAFLEAYMTEGVYEDKTLAMLEQLPGDVLLLMKDTMDFCYRVARIRFEKIFPPKFLRDVRLYEEKLVMDTRAGQYLVPYCNFIKNLDAAIARMGKYMRRPLRKRYNI